MCLHFTAQLHHYNIWKSNIIFEIILIYLSYSFTRLKRDSHFLIIYTS